MFNESLLFLEAINCWMYLFEELISSTSLEILTFPWPAEVRHLSNADCRDNTWLSSARNLDSRPSILTLAAARLLLRSSLSLETASLLLCSVVYSVCKAWYFLVLTQAGKSSMVTAPIMNGKLIFT